jgi:hypothetical protein
MPLTLWRGRARLDVIGGCHRLYLGTHVPNSVGRTNTVLLNPCVTPNEGIYWPYHMIGREEAAQPSGDACL